MVVIACFDPNKVFFIDDGIEDTYRLDTNETVFQHQKMRTLFCNKKVHHVEKVKGKLIRCYDSFTSAFAEEIYTEFKYVPCKKCVGCKLDYSKDWATRCMLEAKLYRYNYFVTLTYDEEHVPYEEFIDDFGNVRRVLSLRFRDFQLWMKSFREEYFRLTGKRGIRFFMCGEYGGKTLRPHYHVILFDCELNDLKAVSESNGGILYASDLISKTWDKGLHGVAECNWNTCAYTARYVIKKAHDNSEFYDIFGIEKEFVNMSRMPGIARWYYEVYKDHIYDTDSIVLNDGLKVKPCKYFDALYDMDNPKEFADIKELRELRAEAQKELILSQTSLDYLDYLAVQGREMEKKTKALNRCQEFNL